ncbi:two-component regulator propeller domain-containing protein [Pseudoalteromonas sp. 3D05]|uniref:two-component regulator propeller domain-containing protein n=1 Tax=unclassified Pseudoalteromonas TaxID=194690 RepID=UPI0031BAD13A
MMKRISLFFFCIVQFTCIAAENTRLPLNDYFSETWNTRTGLPHNSINSVAQTSDGYIWIATWEGLARFNGRDFKLFTRSEIKGLPDSGLRSLSAEPDGSLYIVGARGGISHLKSGQWKTSANAQAMVNHILNPTPSEVWLGLEGKGLVLRDKTTNHESHLLINLSVYRLIQDSNSVIWAATSEGLYRIEDKEPQLITPAQGLPTSSIYTLLLTRQGQLIVGGEKGAWRLVDNRFESVHADFNGESVSSLLEDSNNDLWLGTINKGLFRLSSLGLEQLDSEAGLPANRILSLLQDKEGSIWVGTNGGLFRLREAPFSVWTKKRGLSGNYIRAILSHSDGSIWVGSSSGLNRIKDDKVQSYSVTDQTRPLSVLSLVEDDSGGVWIGTYTSGILRVVDDKIYPILNRDGGLASNEVRALLFDHKQRLWAGTASGLTRIETDGSITQFTTDEGLPGDFIMALSQDANGNIWVGTGVGVAMFNDSLGKFKGQQFPRKFNAEYAFGFYSQNNNMWMTTDRGLIRFNIETGQIDMLGREQGLPVDKLFQLVAQGDLFWLSSNRGIIQIKQQEVNDFLDNKNSNLLQYQLYDEGDGMLSAQANGGSSPAATLHHDGSVWFATANGAASVMPERLKRASQLALPTIIELLVVDGKTMNISNQDDLIELPAGSDRVSFHYAGLSFIMSQRLKFQTKLLGYNDKWVDRHKLNITEYTNLAPGKYTFMVRSSYPNSPWQDNLKAITFVIKPYFWQKVSFKLAVFITILLLCYGLYKYRLYHYKKIEKRLTERVDEQTYALQAQNEAFAHQATHDQLTGIPNRRAFDDWLAENFNDFKQTDKPLALVIVDIDYFKRINDNWSHIVGDRVICVVANILQQCCDDNQYQVSRWGGEEFTLLMPNKSVEQAQKDCEQLREQIANYDFSSIATNLKITASFGVADSRSVDEYDRLLAKADKALYQAKENGRNRIEALN